MPDPRHVSTGDPVLDRRFQWAVGSLAAGDGETALELLEGMVQQEPAFAPAWFELGKAHQALAQNAAAITAFTQYLALQPDDALGAGLRLTTLGTRPAEQALAPGYVRALFDEYAPRFDAHLTGTLHYRGPEILRQALRRVCDAHARPFRFASALDIGCGTGLMGKALVGVAGALHGVDLSPVMLEQAEQSGAYATLAAGEATEFLTRQGDAAFDLVIAADVLVYMGNLAPLFAQVARVLRPGGLFAFTVQHHNGQGFVLGEDARFAHSAAYLRAVRHGAGLSTFLLEPASTRQDRGVEVPGLVAVFGKPAC